MGTSVGWYFVPFSAIQAVTFNMHMCIEYTVCRLSLISLAVFKRLTQGWDVSSNCLIDGPF